MTIDTFFFDYRKPEHKFFQNFDFGCLNIKFFDHSLNLNSISNFPPDVLDNVTVISVFISSYLNEDVLSKFKNLRLIATRSTGVNHIDLEYCKKNHIAVINVQNYGATSVAQYTFTLILALIRQIIPANFYLKHHKARPESFLGRNLDNLTLGVIGTGAIGGSVCALANAFNMKILAYDIHPKQELVLKYNVTYVELDELLENSDVISLHAPLSKENINLLAKPQFKKMKKHPYIINTSRGELINIADLKFALDNKLISGVALDVLTCEALSFTGENFCPILENIHPNCAQELKIVKEIIDRNNVIITPHIAYETQDSIDFILDSTFSNIRGFFKGERNGRVI